VSAASSIATVKLARPFSVWKRNGPPLECASRIDEPFGGRAMWIVQLRDGFCFQNVICFTPTSSGPAYTDQTGHPPGLEVSSTRSRQAIKAACRLCHFDVMPIHPRSILFWRPSIALAIMLGVQSDGFRRGTAGAFDREENPAVRSSDVRKTCDLPSCGFLSGSSRINPRHGHQA
jgi:hypothetical protein